MYMRLGTSDAKRSERPLVVNTEEDRLVASRTVYTDTT